MCECLFFIVHMGDWVCVCTEVLESDSPQLCAQLVLMCFCVANGLTCTQLFEPLAIVYLPQFWFAFISLAVLISRCRHEADVQNIKKYKKSTMEGHVDRAGYEEFVGGGRRLDYDGFILSFLTAVNVRITLNRKQSHFTFWLIVLLILNEMPRTSGQYRIDSTPPLPPKKISVDTNCLHDIICFWPLNKRVQKQLFF